MTLPAVELSRDRHRWAGHRWALYAIVVLAVALRFHALSGPSLWLDEIWGIEIACGHGAEHQDLPTDRILLTPPALTDLSAARPAWQDWTTLNRVTGPPGSYLLLRGWMALFGQTEAAVRSLSAVCSCGAVVLLYLAVLTTAGREPALWAAALMAVAGPQIRAAQDARPYAPLMALATAALWLVARTVSMGPTRRRTVALAAVLFGLLMTHYFAVAAVASVGLYACGWTRGPTRRQLLLAVGAADGLFAMVWGPFMWRQLAAFSPTDRAAAFLHEAGPGHVAATVWRALALPVSLLADARPIPPWYPFVGVVLWAAVSMQLRRAPLWPLWIIATVGLLATLDLTRSTAHLKFLRYALIAGPATYAVVATSVAWHRLAGRALAAVAVAIAAWSLPIAYAPDNADFRSLGLSMRASVQPGELVVFAGPARTYAPQILCLAASYYAGPIRSPVLLLERPATPAVRREIGDRPVVWLVADPEVTFAREWLPGYHLAAGQSWPVVGSLLRMDRDPAPAHGPPA